MANSGNCTRVLTSFEFLDRVKKALGSSYIYYDFSEANYSSSRNLINIRCKKHGLIQVTAGSIMNGSPICRICEKIRNPSLVVKLSKSEFIEVASNVHKNKYSYDLLDKASFENEKIPVVCPSHGKFLIRKSAHISPKQRYGCQKCGKYYSIGEEAVTDYLEKNNIKYRKQVTFEWADISYGKAGLPFDFYLPDLNTLIEYDGIHHFHPTRYGGRSLEIAAHHFKHTWWLDGIKSIGSFLNKIKLIRIPYYKFSELDRILDKDLNRSVDFEDFDQFMSFANKTK